MAGKCSRNGLKVGVWSYYSVDRPPVKFHRIRSSFVSPTVKLYRHYSRSFRRTFSVFGNRCRALSLFSPSQSRHGPPSPSSFPSSLPELSDTIARPETLSAQCIKPPSRAHPKSCPGPDPSSRRRCVRIIPKRVQNITVFLFGLPSVLFSTARF